MKLLGTNRRPAAPARAGLTLIEVILAVMILGIGLAVLLASASRCLRVIQLSRNYHQARGVLELGELDYPLVEQKEEQESRMVNLNVDPVEYPGGYTFSRTTEKLEDEEDLVLVRTRVAWSDRGRNPWEEVVSYLYYTNELP
jgi:prepilin-type N-terminal cleavage/methylation domain-containing protein